MVWAPRKKGFHRKLGLKHPHKGSHAPRPGGHHPHTMHKQASGARQPTGRPHNAWGKNAHHGWPHHKGPLSAKGKAARLGKKHPHQGSHRLRPGGHHHHKGSHKPLRHKGTLHKHAHLGGGHKAHPHKGGHHHAHQVPGTGIGGLALRGQATRKRRVHHGGVVKSVTSKRIVSRGRVPNASITRAQAAAVSRPKLRVPRHHKGRHGRLTMSGQYTGVSTMITVPVHRLIIRGLRVPKPHKSVWVNHRSKHWNYKRGHRKRSW